MKFFAIMECTLMQLTSKFRKKYRDMQIWRTIFNGNYNVRSSKLFFPSEVAYYCNHCVYDK